jgi:hypothetical protein
MLRGRGGYVIGGLRHILTKQPRRKSVRETLAQGITFFHNHRRWMRYDASLAAGLPVGSGVVASTCGSVVKHRMEGEGKRWSLDGAEAILALHSLKKSHDNDLRDITARRASLAVSYPHSRRATTMISVTTGGSGPARCGFASTIVSRNTGPLHAGSV